MLPLKAVLSSLSLSDRFTSLDIYIICKVEAMHCSSLGVSKSSKESVVKLVKHTNTETNDMIYGNKKYIPSHTLKQ